MANRFTPGRAGWLRLLTLGFAAAVSLTAGIAFLDLIGGNRPVFLDWLRTIRANLKHYQPDYRTIIPETRIGFGRKGQSLRDIVLCIDQSGSMAGCLDVFLPVGAALADALRAAPNVEVAVWRYGSGVEKVGRTADLRQGRTMGGTATTRYRLRSAATTRVARCSG